MDTAIALRDVVKDFDGFRAVKFVKESLNIQRDFVFAQLRQFGLDCAPQNLGCDLLSDCFRQQVERGKNLLC